LNVEGLTRKSYGRRSIWYEDDGEIVAKVCTKCRVAKTLEDFTHNKHTLGGREPTCKSCLSAHRDLNKECISARHHKWYINNYDKTVIIELRRRARKKLLPDYFTVTQKREILKYFGGCVLTGDSTEIHWDHVIPISIGHVGTTYGNMVPLRADLNLSKNDSNIFEWFEANRQRFELSQEHFDNLIYWLASANAMTVEEYRDYVYWCHANPRSIDELKDEKEVM
jgi:hypothetical protein